VQGREVTGRESRHGELSSCPDSWSVRKKR
jgi:hypothetical protein